MSRIARVVAPGQPHHVTQRGNRRLPTFFHEDDFATYIDLMAEWCAKLKVDIWAYCLMPNHVHLIAVPHSTDALARAIGEAHRRYSLHINKREGWTGHLWQDRFASFVMDEHHLLTAARYIECNPVRAELVEAPSDYRWSSARAHLTAQDDILVHTKPLLSMMPDWRSFLADPEQPDLTDALRLHTRTGRPLGQPEFLSRLEENLGRPIAPRKRGPKPGAKAKRI